MAEIIRLNKVLRELNISLDRAVDFLETKNVEIEKRPTTKITSEVYDLLAGEFQTDANKKVASKEVGEAKLKEKEALRVQREQEIEQKLQKAEAAKTVFKAKQVLQGPKKIGKIDLEGSKKVAQKTEAVKPVEETKPAPPKVEDTPKVAPTAKVEDTPKVAEDSKPTPTPKVEVAPKASIPEVAAPEAPTVTTEDEVVAPGEQKVETTNYQKLSGPKSTGQKIDLTQFNKPKKSEASHTSCGGKFYRR